MSRFTLQMLHFLAQDPKPLGQKFSDFVNLSSHKPGSCQCISRVRSHQTSQQSSASVLTFGFTVDGAMSNGTRVWLGGNTAVPMKPPEHVPNFKGGFSVDGRNHGDPKNGNPWRVNDGTIFIALFLSVAAGIQGGPQL